MSDNIRKYVEVLAALREDGILTDKKDFTCQIGEWLVEQLYNGKRAASTIQKGWDIKVGDEFWQVKTHSKNEGNSSRFTAIKSDPGIQVDVLIIIVFTYDYKLKEFYKVPWAVAQKLIERRGGLVQKEVLRWKEIEKYRVDTGELPRQEVVGLFR